MGRRTPAESARIAVQRLRDQRAAYVAKVAEIDGQLAGLGIGVAAEPLPAAAAIPAASARPAMADLSAASAGMTDADAKASLQAAIADAHRNPMPLSTQPRPQFRPFELADLGANNDNTSPADNQGAGRWE